MNLTKSVKIKNNHLINRGVFLFIIAVSRILFKLGSRGKDLWSLQKKPADARANSYDLIKQQGEILKGASLEIKERSFDFRNCCVCKSSNYKEKFLSGDGFHYVQCKECGFIYVNPIINEFGWEYLQKNILNYTASANTPFTDYTQSDQGLIDDGKRFGRYLNWLDIFTYGKTMRVLDIGCSTGNFLYFSKQKGWDAIGMEIVEERCEIIRSKYNAEVINYDADKLSGDNHPAINKKFGLITLWETLEHLKDPRKTLDACHKMTDDGGLIAISVPNGASFWVEVQKEKNPDCLGIGHINMFTASTLASLLRETGFKPLFIRTEGIEVVNFSLQKVLFYLKLKKDYNGKNGFFSKRLAGFFNGLIEKNFGGTILICIAQKI